MGVLEWRRWRWLCLQNGYHHWGIECKEAMENMFHSIEFRIKEEIGKDAKPYRVWWNNISGEWRY